MTFGRPLDGLPWYGSAKTPVAPQEPQCNIRRRHMSRSLTGLEHERHIGMAISFDPNRPFPCGVAEIDNEHAAVSHIAARVDSLCRMLRRRTIPQSRRFVIRDQMKDVALDLIDRLSRECADEEAAMRDTGYHCRAKHEFSRHLVDHQAMSERARDVVSALNALLLESAVVLIKDLIEYWLNEHLPRHDLIYAEYVRCTE